MNDTITDPRALQRVRHTVKLRHLVVHSVARLTPHMQRIELHSPDLADFVSAGFDDHVKLFFPSNPAQLPTATADGLSWPEGERPPMRDYTPRRFDAQAHTLTLDFALHDAGPATAWALQAQAGDVLYIGGPRGSMVVPLAFDWYLLVGDETALPAIARRLEELPSTAKALVLVAVDNAADEQALASAAQVHVQWVHREQRQSLLTALQALQFLPGDFHAWVACETAEAKALRAHLVGERQANPKWVRASGYWRRGTAGTHDSIDD